MILFFVSAIIFAGSVRVSHWRVQAVESAMLLELGLMRSSNFKSAKGRGS